MKKKTIPLAVLVILVALAGVWIYRSLNAQADNGIRISGNIELTEVKIGFKTSGLLAELLVDEGDAVKNGLVVARLDREQLLRQKDREEAGVRAARSALAQSRTALEWQRQAVETEIAARQADVRQAEARLRELETGSRPQEIQQAKAAVEAARAEFERARKDWERAQVLHPQDDISTSQFDQFRSRYLSAEAALRQAEEGFALVREGPRQETIEVARAQLERARAGLRQAEVQRLEIRRREQEVAARAAEIDRAQAQLAVVDSQIDDTVAVSPVDGVVLVKSADTGEVLAPGTTVITVGDLDHPWLRGYINETDLGRVKLGQKVRVTTDSYPGKVYGGTVSFISSEAEFTPKQIQTEEERVKLVYRVKIDLENPHRELKLNMPADAEIVLE